MWGFQIRLNKNKLGVLTLGEIIEFKKDEITTGYDESDELIVAAESFLADARVDLSKQQVLSVPIAELGTLGAGIASLLPGLRTVTETMTVDATGGYYKLVNAGVGDSLK